MSEQKQIGQLHASVIQNLPEMTTEQRQRWIGDPMGLQKFLFGLCSSVIATAVSFIAMVFKIIVDRTKPLAEMISAGKYNWVNSNITQENFPITGNGKEEEDLVVFHFNRNIVSEDAIAEMAKENCEPGDIADLCALGKAKPDLQRQFPIVALKSVWRNPSGDLRVPCLYGDGGLRDLSLDCFGAGWDDDYRFLARRKCQKPLGS